MAKNDKIAQLRVQVSDILKKYAKTNSYTKDETKLLVKLWQAYSKKSKTLLVSKKKLYASGIVHLFTLINMKEENYPDNILSFFKLKQDDILKQSRLIKAALQVKPFDARFCMKETSLFGTCLKEALALYMQNAMVEESQEAQIEELYEDNEFVSQEITDTFFEHFFAERCIQKSKASKITQKVTKDKNEEMFYLGARTVLDIVTPTLDEEDREEMRETILSVLEDTNRWKRIEQLRKQRR